MLTDRINGHVSLAKPQIKAIVRQRHKHVRVIQLAYYVLCVNIIEYIYILYILYIFIS